jgi:trimethylamine--corrinoid protein Co-methyltransferase
MARARLSFLTREERELVHASSLVLLSEVGICVKSPAVLKLLQAYGAAVDSQASIARIPQKIVEKALGTAPNQITLCARNPDQDLKLPARDIPYVATNGLAVFVKDLDSGEIRNSTRADLARFARLADALDAVDFLWTALTAGDVPSEAHGPHELWVALQNTTKHVQGITVQSAEDARMQIEVAALVAGGREELKRRPLISVVSAPLSPLSFEGGAIEAQVEFARAGVPIVSMSMSLGGMCAPVTVAGMVTNMNAENLASLVITQAACEGAPYIYSSESMPIDMRDSSVDYGSPEYVLVSTAAAQMARMYNLPCMVGSFGTTAELPGMDGSFCEIFSCAGTTLSGTDLAAGMGSILAAKGCSFEQLIIDAYTWECFRAFCRPHDISPATIALEVMREVGHSPAYLTHEHTVENFKSSITLWDREKLQLQKTYSQDSLPEARETALRLLAEHGVPYLDRHLVAEGDRLLSVYERGLNTEGIEGG